MIEIVIYLIIIVISLMLANIFLNPKKKSAKLYYEAHVTIEPLFGDNLGFAKGASHAVNFKVATLLMQKRPEDTPEISKYDTFITGHGKDFVDISERTIRLIKALQGQGIKVLRYKIEDTVLDSRTKDVFNLL